MQVLNINEFAGVSWKLWMKTCTLCLHWTFYCRNLYLSCVISTGTLQEIEARIVIMSLFLRLTLLLLTLNVLLSCEAYSTYGGSGKYDGGKPAKNPMFSQGTSTGVPGQAARRGLGVSAWGIVVIILGVILGGMGFYYFSMCYPILCKKERNYDMIHLDTA